MYVLHLLFLSCCASIFAEEDSEDDWIFNDSDEFKRFMDEDVGNLDEQNVQEYSLDESADYFNIFELLYKIYYESEEEKAERLKTFKDNVAKVNKLNNQSGTVTFGITKFMDLTPDEFQEQYTGLEVDPDEMNDADPEFRATTCKYYKPGSFTNKKKPASVDYRDFNCVTPVRNQGSCASCYAFTVSAMLEIQHCLTNGKLETLAPQQIVDCDKKSYGCNRGYLASTVQNLIDNGGIMTEKDYPYKSKTGTSCQFKKDKAVVKPIGCSNLKPRDQSEAETMLSEMGPLAIAVPSKWGLQYYTGGVINKCDGQHDHAMLLIGYGKVDDQEVFIVKNSWGENWGYKGYGLISAKQGEESCKILKYPMTAVTVEKIKD